MLENTAWHNNNGQTLSSCSCLSVLLRMNGAVSWASSRSSWGETSRTICVDFFSWNGAPFLALPRETFLVLAFSRVCAFCFLQHQNQNFFFLPLLVKNPKWPCSYMHTLCCDRNGSITRLKHEPVVRLWKTHTVPVVNVCKIIPESQNFIYNIIMMCVR